MTGRKLRFRMVAVAALVAGAALSFESVRPVLAAEQASPAAPPAQAGPHGPNEGRGGPWKWWNDPGVQKDLGLTADKTKRIDDFFERRSKDLGPMAEEWQRQAQELENMTKAAVTDESAYQLQVIRVESLGARLRESRTMMLYRIYRELQPEQYKKLQEILDRRYGRSSTPSGRGRE